MCCAHKMGENNLYWLGWLYISLPTALKESFNAGFSSKGMR